MGEKLNKKIEVMANFAIVLVAIMIIGVVGYKYFWTATENQPELNEVKVGESLNLPDINWSQKKQTLVLVLAKGCHFCSESVPFYQRIVQKIANSSETKLVAAFPNSVEIGKDYLRENSLLINEVAKVNFNAAKIRGTPTILLVDEKGIVKNIWLGMLKTKEEEEELLKTLL